MSSYMGEDELAVIRAAPSADLIAQIRETLTLAVDEFNHRTDFEALNELERRIIGPAEPEVPTRQQLEEAIERAKTVPKDEGYTLLLSEAMKLKKGDPDRSWLLEQMRQMFATQGAPKEKENSND